MVIESHPESVNTRVAKGAAWMVLLRVIDRSIGLISMVVLARMLVPSDFGLVALAGSLIAILEVLGAVGLDMALIQQSQARREHFDSAWTFHVLFGLVTGAIVLVVAPAVAGFYDDPRLVAVMYMLALAHAIHAFENIGVVAFRKELAFEREFRYRLTRRLISTFVVTIPLAIALQSYWALLIGGVVGALISVLLSYWLHPYRPRLSFAALGQLMNFSKWFLLTSVVEFLYGRMASLVIGRFAGPAPLGAYTLANDLAAIATQEISAPIHRAVYPGYAQLANDRARLQQSYLGVVSMLALVVLPAAVGLSLIAEPAVLIVLGDRWHEAVPLVRVLVIDAALTVFLSTVHFVNLAVGMARATSLLLAAHAAMTIPMMLLSVPAHGALGAAISMLIASIVVTPFKFVLLRRAIGLSFTDFAKAVLRPALATAVMGAIVWSVSQLWPMPAAMLDRIAYGITLVAVGALAYAGTLFALWRAQGRPAGAEATILAHAPAAWLSVRARLGMS